MPRCGVLRRRPCPRVGRGRPGARPRDAPAAWAGCLCRAGRSRCQWLRWQRLFFWGMPRVQRQPHAPVLESSAQGAPQGQFAGFLLRVVLSGPRQARALRLQAHHGDDRLPGFLRRFYGRAQALPLTGHRVAGRDLGREARATCPGNCLLIERLQQLANAHMRGQAVSQGEVVGEKGGIAAAKRTDFALAHVPAGRGQGPGRGASARRAMDSAGLADDAGPGVG